MCARWRFDALHAVLYTLLTLRNGQIDFSE